MRELILRTEDAPELLKAFDEILSGHPYVGASVLPLILSNFAGGGKNSRSSDINSLSDRELEIFSFIGRGVSVSELASELHVSVKTIETHQMRMKEKLALHTAAELRQKAREWLAKSAVNRIREDPELPNETDRALRWFMKIGRPTESVSSCAPVKCELRFYNCKGRYANLR